MCEDNVCHIAGLEIELSARGYGLLLQMVPTIEDELATITKWRNARRVDGPVMVELRFDDPRVELGLKPGALPMVVVGDPRQATDERGNRRRRGDPRGHRPSRRPGPPADRTRRGIGNLAHTGIRDAAFEGEMRSRGMDPVLVRTDFTPGEGADRTRSLLDRGLASSERGGLSCGNQMATFDADSTVSS